MKIFLLQYTFDCATTTTHKEDLIDIFISSKLGSTLNNMGTSMFYGATKETFRYAHYLRKHLTPAEEKLWGRLCNNATGFRFRCQHPISKYVVDFYCHPCKLIIEVDGSYHLLDEIFERDKDRQLNLISFELSVLRFSNEHVYGDIESVLKCINEKISSMNSIQVIKTRIEKNHLLSPR